MSMFLGPIHYSVYNRVLVMVNLAEKIANEYSIELSETKVIRGNLEEIIDKSNIHGWLSSQIEAGENYYFSALRKSIDKKGLDETRTCLERLQRSLLEEKKTSLEDIAGQISSYFIDGMPCDRGSFLELGQGELNYQINPKVHEKSFIETGLSEEEFMILREARLKGLLDGTGFVLVREGNGFVIR